MKKLVMILMSVFCIQSVTFADNDRLIQFSQLPVEAQQTVNNHFNGKKVAYTMVDPGFGRTYEVVFVPQVFIPEAIQAYVNTNFPGAYICHIDIKGNKKEVELSNGLELKFNSRNLVVEIDD